VKKLEANSLVRRIVWGLGIGCAALATGACSDPMPVGGSGDQLPGGGDNGDENSGEQCGGIVGVPCPSGKYCDFESSCGYADMTGKCRTMPTSCEEECTTKVCGCDGLTYCNACLAHFAGVDDTSDLTSCGTPPTTPPPPPPTNN
jgi:hypothetical protein